MMMRRTRMGEDESSRAKKCDDRIKSLRLEMMLSPSTAIHRICRSGDLRSLLCLLAESRGRHDDDIVNEKNPGGLIALHFAAAHGHLDICKVLLRSGSYLNFDFCSGITPLHIAAAYNQSEIVKLLLQHSDEKQISRASKILGDTPLHLASRAGHVSVVKVLLANDAVDIDAVTPELRSSTHCAAQNGHVDVVNVLIKNGANVLLRDKRGRLASELAMPKFNAVASALEDRMHEVLAKVLADAGCTAHHCHCNNYHVGTKRHACACGHGPLLHCSRAEEARKVLETSGCLNGFWESFEKESHRESKHSL